MKKNAVLDSPNITNGKDNGLRIIRECRAELQRLETRKAHLEDEMRRWSWVRWNGETKLEGET